MLGGKGNFTPLVGKKGDMSSKFMSGIKGAARMADDPAFQFISAVLEPELAAGFALAKKTGLLKKVAGM